LGRANYADKKGEYYTAFFGLSVGLERLIKLVLVADYAISNNGQMPDERIVRKFGHRLVELTKAADMVAQKHRMKLAYPCSGGGLYSEFLKSPRLTSRET
jgi:hypothetical protein